MAEWTIYDEIHAPHLEGNFVATEGQFLLTELPGNRTLLAGTTWYHQRLWPVAYWRPWADHIIHRIHMRVLRHIKAQAES